MCTFDKGMTIYHLAITIIWFVIVIFDLHIINDFANFLKIFIQSYSVGTLLVVSITDLINGESK